MLGPIPSVLMSLCGFIKVKAHYTSDAHSTVARSEVCLVDRHSYLVVISV